MWFEYENSRGVDVALNLAHVRKLVRMDDTTTKVVYSSGDSDIIGVKYEELIEYVNFSAVADALSSLRR